MADDEEGGYVDSFVAADDGALMQAIQQRDAAIAPLIRCVSRVNEKARKSAW
jgi:hypothetical protein